ALVRGRTAMIDCTRLEPLHHARGVLRGGLREEIASVRRAGATVIFVDHADVLSEVDDRAALASLVDETAGTERGLVIATRDRALVEDVVGVSYRHLTLGAVPDLADSHRI
ncbi:MAG TPA: MMPL family transporter, partial [Microlunatus sp.]|nr:MMPL family transporter [Microlunatus sp.]